MKAHRKLYPLHTVKATGTSLHAFAHCQSINQSVSPTVSQSVSQSVSESVSQSVSSSASRPPATMWSIKNMHIIDTYLRFTLYHIVSAYPPIYLSIIIVHVCMSSKCRTQHSPGQTTSPHSIGTAFANRYVALTYERLSYLIMSKK
ncbi:uncharacterized protein LOC125500041 [Athalia rosae]|uniref:uncharacterized protein LOC125500041 n=1 Tax=Athalia rosae TaxID=37344 RepID=UPI0020336252|nr:uncharacterized protein LOC125500041 [Athalia rosae]